MTRLPTLLAIAFCVAAAPAGAADERAAADPATGSGAAAAGAAETSMVSARPAYQQMRQDEDWSSLGGGSNDMPPDLFDPIKYVKLSSDGWAWASFGGQGRLRFESIDGAGFNSDSDFDDSFLLSRLFLHADVHAGEHLRGFVQLKSAMVSDFDLPGGAGPVRRDNLALQSGFLELNVPVGEASLRLRGGRQELAFGAQRLVTVGEWDNTRLTFDGVRARLSLGGADVDAFFARPVRVREHSSNDSDPDRQFYGLYASGRLPGSEIKLEAYALGFEADDAFVAGTAGDDNRYTFGARLAGEVPGAPLDFDVEGAWQAGRVGAGSTGGDVSAFFASGELGLTPGGPIPGVRVFAGLDYASGDDDPGGDVDTFNQLFNDGHAYFGFVDTVGRQNVFAAKLGASAQPLENLSIWITGHYFRRAEEEDAFYGPGGVVRAAGGSSERELGFETDIGASYRIGRHAVVELQYNRFFAGDFIEETGDDEDIDAFYAIVQYTF